MFAYPTATVLILGVWLADVSLGKGGRQMDWCIDAAVDWLGLLAEVDSARREARMGFHITNKLVNRVGSFALFGR